LSKQHCPVPLAVLAAALLAAASPAIAQSQGGGMHRHGAGGMMMHDEVTMPGLRGLDATPEESAEMMVMFHHFPEIFRRSRACPTASGP
jgi:Spy/CpxP family protein refolding chaperone